MRLGGRDGQGRAFRRRAGHCVVQPLPMRLSAMNATGLASFRARAQSTLEELFPATIKLGEVATEYAAAVGSFRRADKLAPGGFLNDDDVVFRVRKDLVSERPEVGLRLVWVQKTITFRIVKVSEGGADNAWHIACKAVDK